MDCIECGEPLVFGGAETLHLEEDYEVSGVIGSASTNQTAYIFECVECGLDERRIKFFSMNLRPQAAEDTDAVLEFCRDEGIIGTGWGHRDRDFESSEDYLSFRRDNEPETGSVLRPIKDFVIWMKPDDIVFLYDKPSSQYYLARVTGEWQYINNAHFSREMKDDYKQHDVWQFRTAEWHKMSRKYLTGDVLSGTPPRGTIQKKKSIDEDQAKYLSLLPDGPDIDRETDFGRLQDRMRKRAFGSDGDPSEIIRLLTDDELETIVINFVQRRTGAVLMQNTTGDALPDIESLLRKVGNDGSPRTIGTQVKRGALRDRGDLENFLKNADELYIYCTGGSDVDGAIEISDRELAGYMCNYIAELPPSAILRVENVIDRTKAN